jgi:oxygen-independent coproporphyrinogen-3 oxidase
MYSDRPWGSLTGVRPAKIVHRRLDLGEQSPDIERFLTARYGVEAEKASLLVEVAERNRRLAPTPQSAEQEKRVVSLYLGIPYCSSRCVYCSFPSALLPTDKEQTICLLTAIGQDIQAVVKLLSAYGLTVRALYIGGGTPTCLPDELLARLLGWLSSSFDIPAMQEFTVEAGRPDSITPEKLQLLRQAGVTRVSVNPQTMRQLTLDRIGRNHSSEQTLRAFAMARAAGFCQINMDLIAGLPGETLPDMQGSLAQVLALKPENITVHTLALKRGAALRETTDAATWQNNEVVCQMVDASAREIRSAGLLPYYIYRQKNSPGNRENVGYARPGTECIYNVDMIEERRTIIGMGPSATSKAIRMPDWRLDGCFFPKDIPTYIRRIAELANKREQLIKTLFSAE